MNPDPDVSPVEAAHSDRLHDLVADALDLPSGERVAFLTKASGDDAALLAEACALVEYDQPENTFLGETAYMQMAGEDLGGIEAGTLAPGTMLGEYRVLSLLGEGGMSKVYLAEDTKLERRVAVKLLKHRLDDGRLARRFRHERKVLAALTHPNIARLYGGGITPEGCSYLVMEYVEGERLDKFCDRHGLDIKARLALFRKVCTAVSYAHQNLVVHRDLKPANVRVTPEGEPKLLDFGIAKLLDPEGASVHVDPTVTLSGAMTPEYASPEQLKGEAITTVSDVYSLGVILYELLCGQRPYAGLKSRRPDELVRAICEQEPPRPSTVACRTTLTATVPAGQVPVTRERPATLRRLLEGDLDNIVAKALRTEPARRYPSVLALSEDLRRHFEGLPVTARKDTLRYRADKFIRRNRAGVAAAALVVLALVTGLVTAIWEARLARQERDRAQTALTQAKIAQRQAEQVDDFLQGLFASADPAKLGKDVRMVQVIDAAAKNLDRDLANEPAVLLQAHFTLGRTYHNLGLYELAEKQARAALVLARRLHGNEATITAGVELILGRVLSNRQQVAEAESLLRHALSIYRAQLQPDRAALAETLALLGYTLYSQPGRAVEAATMMSEALGFARGVWGERDPKYLNVLMQSGTVKTAMQDYAGGEQIYRQVLSIQDQIMPGDVAALAPQFNLCLCLLNQGNFAGMEVVLNRLDADIQRLVGEKSIQFAAANFARGLLDFSRGAYGANILHLQTALRLFETFYPPDAVSVVQSQAVLGLCLTRENRAAEGEPLLRAAYEHGAKVDRVNFAHTIVNIETALGECLLAQNRYAEAEPLLLTGHDDLAKRLGPQNRLTVQAAQRLHDLYAAWNKPAEAARYANTSGGLPVPPAR